MRIKKLIEKLKIAFFSKSRKDFYFNSLAVNSPTLLLDLNQEPPRIRVGFIRKRISDEELLVEVPSLNMTVHGRYDIELRNWVIVE